MSTTRNWEEEDLELSGSGDTSEDFSNDEKEDFEEDPNDDEEYREFVRQKNQVPQSTMLKKKKKQTTFIELLNTICDQSNISIAQAELFPEDQEHLNNVVPAQIAHTIRETDVAGKFAKFTQLFNKHLKAVKPHKQARSRSSAPKEKRNPLADQSSVMNSSLAKLIRDQRVHNWSFKEFKPKEEEAFRAGEFARYVTEFEAYADTSECSDKEKLHAMQFKSGEVIGEALQVIECTTSTRFGSFDRIVTALKDHWKQATNPAVVEEMFKSQKRGESEQCLSFLRRLQRNSKYVTKLEEAANYEIARENLVIATAATGMKDKELQKLANSMLKQYKMTDVRTNRLLKLTNAATSTDVVTPTLSPLTDEVSLIERDSYKRKKIDNPHEYMERVSKRRHDEDYSYSDTRRSGGGVMRSRPFSRNMGFKSQNSVSYEGRQYRNQRDVQPMRRKCERCTKFHDTNKDCPKCNECGKIGHFAYQTYLCSSRQKTELESRTDYRTETFDKRKQFEDESAAKTQKNVVSLINNETKVSITEDEEYSYQ